jgi:hypothetical protein
MGMTGSRRGLVKSLRLKELSAAHDTPELRRFLESVEAALRGEGAEVLHSGRNTVTAVRISPAGGRSLDLVVKEFGLRGFLRLKTLLVPSKAAKAWRGAKALLAAGLQTPAPVAWLEARRGGTVRRALFITERAAGTEIRGILRDRPEAELRPLLGELARVLRAGHDRGVLHRDLSDGNVLVERRADGGYDFRFLDTNRVRRRGRIGGRARAKNLIRLGIPPALRGFFLERYAGGDGPTPAFARRYNRAKAAYERFLKFKKKAKLRRLAQKLKIQ